MPRGLFTQCVCVLLQEPVGIDAVAEALKAYPIRDRLAPADHWAKGGPAVTLDYRPDVNGVAMVDVVDQPWPDALGDPQNETELFTAWSQGHFGPTTYPGSLLRASQQAWAWKAGREVVLQHRAFVRARITYALNAGPDAPLFPPGWDTIGELEFLTKVAHAILGLPQALCYFNPNGEVLRDKASLESQLPSSPDDPIPIELWANVRIYQMDPAGELMDTVGNGQLNAIVSAGGLDDLRDIEAVFPAKRFDYREVDEFLRDLSLYLYDKGDVIKDGDTIPGPGGVEWTASLHDEPVTPPKRRTVRVGPADTTE